MAMSMVSWWSQELGWEGCREGQRCSVRQGWKMWGDGDTGSPVTPWGVLSNPETSYTKRDPPRAATLRHLEHMVLLYEIKPCFSVCRETHLLCAEQNFKSDCFSDIQFATKLHSLLKQKRAHFCCNPSVFVFILIFYFKPVTLIGKNEV